MDPLQWPVISSYLYSLDFEASLLDYILMYKQERFSALLGPGTCILLSLGFYLKGSQTRVDWGEACHESHPI